MIRSRNSCVANAGWARRYWYFACCQRFSAWIRCSPATHSSPIRSLPASIRRSCSSGSSQSCRVMTRTTRDLRSGSAPSAGSSHGRPSIASAPPRPRPGTGACPPARPASAAPSTGTARRGPAADPPTPARGDGREAARCTPPPRRRSPPAPRRSWPGCQSPGTPGAAAPVQPGTARRRPLAARHSVLPAWSRLPGARGLVIRPWCHATREGNHP